MSRSSLGNPLGLLVGLAVIAGALYVWYEGHGPGYADELDVIRDALGRLPQVERLELGGVEEQDMPLLRALDHVTARLGLAGGGELVVAELTEDSVRETGHLLLVSVGPYDLRVRGAGAIGVTDEASGEPVRSEFVAGAMDVGPDGRFAGLVPFPIPNVQTAVERYDELLGLVAAWPRTPAPPAHLRDDQGTDAWYWVATEGEPSSDPNWTAPLDALAEAAGG